MLFNSYEFLFLFLPIVLLGYYVLFARRGRLVFLTLMSYVFYGWWDYRFCGLMLVSTLIDYIAGMGVDRSSGDRRKKLWVVVSIVSNLGLLGFFKYFDLMAGTLNQLASLLGEHHRLIPLLRVTLPVGISFYTFQSMSYTIDIYRGAARPARSFWDFACYVALFPQLVAGPIVRYHELADQLIHRSHTIGKALRGVRFFVLGLTKKVILADGVAFLAAEVFDRVATPDLIVSWGGVLAYAMQIYFDFSGYSDMAVGLGLLLGFEFPQNFDSPYKAVSITDFWRRWHMSLSTWLRDYLYIPLGGNRFGLRRTYINLFLTMLLGGLWHGANWTFLIWGGYHGTLLAIERAVGKKGLFWWAPRPAQQAGTFVLVLIGWVIFRCTTLQAAGSLYAGMLGLNGFQWSGLPFVGKYPLVWIILPAAMLIAWSCRNTWELNGGHSTPVAPTDGGILRERPVLSGVIEGTMFAALFLLCVGVILVNSSSPFLYFQF